MQRTMGGLAIVVGYLALAAISALLTNVEADAWTVWLAGGFTLGLLLGLPRKHWWLALSGSFIAALIFGVVSSDGLLLALAYAAIDIATALLGAWLASVVAPLPLKLESPRELGAAVAGGLLLSAAGALLAAGWSMWSPGDPPGEVLVVWFTSNLVGCVLVAPLLVSWLQFRPKRSGGLPMPGFLGGGLAAVLFLGGLLLVFSGQVSEGLDSELAYLPVLFLALVALAWGARGATLVALIGALIATVYTVGGRGPFISPGGLVDEDVLKVQGYAVAMSLTALLVATLSAAQRNALLVAREWKTRFEAAIGAHRLLAYEWDPQSGRLQITGDSGALLGVPPAALATLADWLALVRGDDRERVNARFELRAQGDGSADALAYALSRGDGAPVTVTDESRAIRDHDGALHRVVGIVRVASAG